MSKERAKELLSILNKELKTSFTLGNDPSKIIQRVSTGELVVDNLLGGGLPRRGISIFYGVPSSGKTVIAQRTAASVQADDGVAALVDAEYSFDPIWASKNGINLDEYIHVEPDSGEQALEAVITLCKQNIDLIIVDSVAGLVPKDEAEGGMDSWQQGLQARLLNKFFRKVMPHNKNTCIIMINQVRKSIGTSYGPYVPDALPGGLGQEFFAKVILNTKKGDLIWKEGQSSLTKGAIPIGFNIRILSVKDKAGGQVKGTCEVPFLFTAETDPLDQIFQVGMFYDIISQSGPYYSFGEHKFQGKKKFINFLDTDEEARTKLITKIQEEIDNDS